MFKYDVYDRPIPETLYLCKPDGSLICELNGIDEASARLVINMNNQYELTFDYDRYIITYDGIIESNGYFELTVEMKILLKSVGYFVVKYPPMEDNGEKEKKTVTAYSCECELEKKDLVNFKINTGESDSLEYLVTYEDGETEALLNEYTGLPYDYIVFENTYPEQLEELSTRYENDTTVQESARVSELVSICTMIPRLKSKITEKNGEFSLTEYVSYTYDSSGENVTRVYLASNFLDRVQELIEFYTKYHDQLSLVSLALANCSCNWKVDTIDSSLANKKFQFSIDGQNIYSFLTNEVASVAECVFSFDIFNKTVSAELIENIGKDSGIIIDKNNLINSITVSSDDDDLYTRYNVSGADGLSIEQVNFGSTRIDDLSYVLDAMDENGKRIYVSDELATKYFQFAYDRELARKVYIDYTKEYNQILIDIDELKYRVPNDVVQTDWDTYTLSELEAALTTYKNLLVTLISLYKEDYGGAGIEDDGSVKESYIKDTPYWYDYYAYQQAIIQIESAYNARLKNSSYSEIEARTDIDAWKTEWSLYGTVELQNKIDSYNNSMSVLIDGGAVVSKYPPQADYYGLCTSKSTEDEKRIDISELAPENFDLDGYIIKIEFTSRNANASAVSFEINFINSIMYINTISNCTWEAGDILYFSCIGSKLYLIQDTGEIYAWDELTTEQQAEYASEDPNYYYDAYMELYYNRESCQEYLDGLLAKLEEKQAELETFQDKRTSLINLVTLEGYSRSALGRLVDLPSASTGNNFTEDEIKIINLLYMDVDYTNENILTTSLDTTVTAVDVQYDLLLDARENLTKVSQPQVTFSAEIDNLLAIPEFKDFDFTVGNYVTVQYYDDYYVTLRLYSIIYNPCLPENTLEVTFTNYIRSRSERSDLSYILDQVSSSGGGSGSNGSGATYGNDIDATISDTMLAKLLNTEMFGTRVSNIILDTIDVNSLYAKVATFGGLGNGTTVINGGCIRTGCIVSANYVGDVSNSSTRLNNTKGTIIDLDNGGFNFAGGKIKGIASGSGDNITYSLSIEGDVTATSFEAKDSVYIYDDDGNKMCALYSKLNDNELITHDLWVGSSDTVNDLYLSGKMIISCNDFFLMSDEYIGIAGMTTEGVVFGNCLNIQGDKLITGIDSNGMFYSIGAGPNMTISNYSGEGNTSVKLQALDDYAISLMISSSETNRGLYDHKEGAWMIFRDSDNITHLSGTVTSTQFQDSIKIIGKDDYAISLAINSSSDDSETNKRNRGIYDHKAGTWMIFRDSDDLTHISGTVTSTQFQNSVKVIGEDDEDDIACQLYIENKRTGLYRTDRDDWIIYQSKTCAVVIGSDNYDSDDSDEDPPGIYLYNGVRKTSPSTNSYNLCINNQGKLSRSTESSIRYKNIIKEMDTDEIEQLYDIPVYWFNYKENYLDKDDERYLEPIPGFIAEKWDEVMPITINHNEEGQPEMWNSNIVVPLMFEMIKNDHEIIQSLKEEIAELKSANN